MIWKIIVNALKIFGILRDPDARKKRRRAKIYAELKDLEDQTAVALAAGDPMRAAALAKKLKDLRQKIRYVEGDE